jgi:DoxX-like family
MKNKKTIKIVHWIFTGLVAAFLLMSVGMYLSDPEKIKGFLEVLEFPTWLFYHIVFAKALGAIFILVRKWPSLTEWAYAGLTFEFSLALSSHVYKGDGQFGAALMALALLMVSYATYKMLQKR